MKDAERGAAKFGGVALALIWVIWAVTFARAWPGYILFLTSAMLLAALLLGLLYRLGQWKLRPDGTIPGLRPGKRSAPWE